MGLFWGGKKEEGHENQLSSDQVMAANDSLCCWGLGAVGVGRSGLLPSLWEVNTNTCSPTPIPSVSFGFLLQVHDDKIFRVQGCSGGEGEM